jgi:hypothetical protein
MASPPTAVVKNTLLLAAYVGVPLFSVLAVTFGVSFVASWINGWPMMATPNFLTGIMCGLIAVLIIAGFHLRRSTVQLRVSHREAFVRRMQRILEDLGHEWIHMTDVHWRTRPRFRARVLGEGITMVLEGSTATITGPRMSLDQIRRRYRLASQFDKVHESIDESRSRVAECFMKRFELSVRLEPEQIKEFQTHVLEVLGKNSEVILDVQMMFASEQGVRESVWANEVRPWLEEQGIYFDFHKDHPQRVTTPAIKAPHDPFIDTCLWQ